MSSAHGGADDQMIRGAANGVLMFHAEAVDDLESTRIAFENRAREIEKRSSKILAEPAWATAAQLGVLEEESVIALQDAMRAHPLGPWVKRTIGVGDKQAARLIATIGDPAWNSLHERPRTLRELYAFCGLHVLDRPSLDSTANRATAGQGSDPAQTRNASQRRSGGTIGHPDQAPLDSQDGVVGVAPSRAKGRQANWSTAAKTRVYLVAESCLRAKKTSPFGKLYAEARVKYADSVHQVECRQCGPKGNPALIGSELSKGHKHARAMRIVMKAILRDLWCAARELHASPESQNQSEPRATTTEPT